MTGITVEQIDRIQGAVKTRSALFDSQHSSALRLFNGFSEGFPGLVIDLYGRSLVFFNLQNPSAAVEPLISLLQPRLLQEFPWIRAVVIKTRHAADPRLRQGILAFGDQPDREISEFGVRYALDLTMNQDASFYLDTRNLRGWLQLWTRGKLVLNTFAYTGSLGAAALAGRAERVVQLDLNDRFLSLARLTCQLNNFPVRDQDFQVGDFFRQVGQFRTQGVLFDCVILDPPFFSVTQAGRVDTVAQHERLINKVRPLIAHNGWLVAVNNALYVSGEEYLTALKRVCSSGYLELEEIIPVPLDVTGYPDTLLNPNYPADPSPFNHPTKMVVLRVRRKDQAAARGL